MSKMKICKHCGAPIARNAKVCPACGGKSRKPVLLRPWFWAVMIVAVILMIPMEGEDSLAG